MLVAVQLVEELAVAGYPNYQMIVVVLVLVAEPLVEALAADHSHLAAAGRSPVAVLVGIRQHSAGSSLVAAGLQSRFEQHHGS